MCIEHIHPIGKIIIGKNKNSLPSEVQESIYEETMNYMPAGKIRLMHIVTRSPDTSYGARRKGLLQMIKEEMKETISEITKWNL